MDLKVSNLEVTIKNISNNVGLYSKTTLDRLLDSACMFNNVVMKNSCGG